MIDAKLNSSSKSSSNFLLFRDVSSLLGIFPTLKKLTSKIVALSEATSDDIIKIKLQEVVKSIKPLSKRDKVNDNHLVNIMQYYELIKELKEL